MNQFSDAVKDLIDPYKVIFFSGEPDYSAGADINSILTPRSRLYPKIFVPGSIPRIIFSML